MTDRRHLLGAALAAWASPLVLAAPQGTARQARGAEHFLPGGSGGIQRGQFGFTATGKNGGYGIIALPLPGTVYMIPLTTSFFDESGGTRYQLLNDGLVTIAKDGVYDLTANLDWPAQSRGSGQDGYDTNLRKLMIKRVPVGVTPPVYTPGEVTKIGTDGKLYDTLGAHDTPGSSAPLTVRTALAWAPGPIPAGGMVSLDVDLPAGSFAPAVGDLARASHSSLSDEVLGSANLGLQISARVVAPLRARVMIENRYGSAAVSVPTGSLNLLVESAVASAGNSSDAWAYLGSGAVRLLVGEKLMIAVRSESPGDFLQIDKASFLRITNLAV